MLHRIRLEILAKDKHSSLLGSLKSNEEIEYGTDFPSVLCLTVGLAVVTMEQHTLRNVNDYLNNNIYSYLETSGGQSSNIYLKVVIFSTPVLIRHLWQFKTIVFLHWCLIRAVLLQLVCFSSSPSELWPWSCQ